MAHELSDLRSQVVNLNQQKHSLEDRLESFEQRQAA